MLHPLRLFQITLSVCLIIAGANTASGAPVGTATFVTELQGSPTDFTTCTLVTYDNTTYNVFGTPVNLASQAGQAFCTGSTVGGVSQGSTCQSTTAGAFSFDSDLDAICDPPSCLGHISFVSSGVTNVTGSIPSSLGDVILTFDGAADFVDFGGATIPGCSNPGSGPRYSGTAAINAFQRVATTPGNNTVSTTTTYFNPATGQESSVNIGITFGNVDSAGSTVVTAVSNVSGSIASNFATDVGGYQVTYLDIVTTADYTPPVTICTSYEDIDDDGVVDGTTVPETALSFLHQEAGVFVDRTSSRDTVNNTICATVDSFSFFGVFVRTTGICSTIGAPCDDGDTCTATDVCDGNLDCVGSGSIDCDDGSECTADSCVSPVGCVHLAPTAPICEPAAKTSITIKRDDANPTKSNLLFKWQGGTPLVQGDFGDPTAVATDDYRLCIYDGDGLLYETELAAAGTCGDKPCWSPLSTKGFKYKDKAGTSGGITGAQLKSGDTAKNKALAKGKGAGISFLQAPGKLALPVSARVLRTGTNLCFEGIYDTDDTVTKNDGIQFKGKQKTP